MGVDVGSTTLKIMVLDQTDRVVYRVYRRHQAAIKAVFVEELQKLQVSYPQARYRMMITGSAGMGVADRVGIPFLQEVIASVEVIRKRYPKAYTLIDLGGEDAKMVFFENGKQPDIRMNGACAGGTGAFIDQMADLMNISVDELGQQALKYEKILPVASRCGVFAKTDVQNLISRNVPLPDIAMSILHAVALQSLATLARGYDIRPDVVCIGGPLTFLPALRNAFRDVLHVKEDELILPENSEYFPAWGCAISDQNNGEWVDLSTLIQKLNEEQAIHANGILPPLFANEQAYDEWKKQRNIKPLKREPLGKWKKLDCFLGVDSGSTTTKVLVIDTDGDIVYTYYAANKGNSLNKVIEGLREFEAEAAAKGVTYRFLSSAVTGYGEDLIHSALDLDYGIVETMAHLSGAQYVDPDVTFVLDIGGQDMKSIFIQDGVISHVELNESCSSGCGSFLQNFASTMDMPLEEFATAACLADNPSDLGSRCTVFMNSKVKQSLREDAGMGDIAAGLAYSVVKNCLFKVLKITNLNTLGDHIVVQGGTFRNDAVYRALELLSGKLIGSTDAPEMMGALGAALYARKMWQKEKKETRFTGQLPDVDKIATKELQCKGCTNKCSVLRFKFENGNISYAGNKCEKVFFNQNHAVRKGFNAFEEKNQLLFDRPCNHNEGALTIGIPRVLNMFENYPFWHALFTECGLNVQLSPESTNALYQRGVCNVMSDNICFPAKLVFGHVISLAESKVDRIFYPIVPKEELECHSVNNSFNCPVVSGYPDVVNSSLDPEARYGICYDKPVITFSNIKALKRGCHTYLSSLGVADSVFNKAFDKAIQAKDAFRDELLKSQRKKLGKVIQSGELAIVVAGRPYHTDPLVHQKVGQILADLGANVFTDDVFRMEDDPDFKKLNIISQWSYPDRVIQAALEVSRLPKNVQLVQLNSFGCGPDSFFMDETRDILNQAGKNHTLLRIDEISSPGSIRLRMRSLVESLKAAAATPDKPASGYTGYPTRYQKSDRKKTILAPWFADFISPFLPAIFELAGYKIVNLPKSSRESAENGLKYGHDEVCYPSTLVLGDIITALQSGKYDLNDVVVAITQTGGQCRATNYIAQIKTGLQNAGFSHIPVIVVGKATQQNEQKAFKLPIAKYIQIILNMLLYADALQQMYSLTIVREKHKGDTQKLFDEYVDRGIELIKRNDYKAVPELMRQAVADFNQVDIYDKEFKQVGLIGEIYVKYNNYGQAYITDWLREKGCVVVTPPIMDFFIQYLVNSEVNKKNGVARQSSFVLAFNPVAWKLLSLRIEVFEAIKKDFRFYHRTETIYEKAEFASEILDLSNQFGEGWNLAAEVACYARQGITEVVCLQPFGCIANHIVAKGIEKRLKKFYPDMNLLYLDIDAGVADVNLQNRLHFMIS